MSDFFDKKDIEPQDDFFAAEDITVEPEDISQAETAARGALQGATLGFADEAEAAGSTIIDDIKKALTGSDEAPMEYDEIGRPIIPEDSGAAYQEALEDVRGEYKTAAEAHPATALASEIAGGVLPGLLTGGGATAANIAKSGTQLASKEALKKAVTEGGKLGAKYGAASGAGYSEGETPTEVLSDTLIGAGTGALGGALLPSAVEGVKGAGKVLAKSNLGQKVKGVKDTITSAPIIHEGLDSFQFADQGKSVLGKGNYENILNESKELVQKELKPFLELNKDKYGTAIGSLVKKIKKVTGSKDMSKSLEKIENQARHMLEKNKAPTEEGKVVLNELINVLDGMKTSTKTTVTPTKTVQGGADKALATIQDKITKAKAVAKETGDDLNFTEPKIDPETGLVTSFETNTGKVISTPIKSGEYTPVKINQKTSYEDMDARQIKDLSSTAYQLLDKANKTAAGIAKKPAAKLYGTAKDAVSDLAEESGLGKTFSDINKKFSGIMDIDESLPASLLKGDSDVAEEVIVNKVSQFLRKAELEGMSGDDLRDGFNIFADKLKVSNPEFADKFLSKANEVARRYELAKTSKQQIKSVKKKRRRIYDKSPNTTTDEDRDLANFYSAQIEDMEYFLNKAFPKRAAEKANNDRNADILNLAKRSNVYDAISWEELVDADLNDVQLDYDFSDKREWDDE